MYMFTYDFSLLYLNHNYVLIVIKSDSFKIEILDKSFYQPFNN